MSKVIFEDMGNFDSLTWHDCCIHSISFNPIEPIFKFDIDYIYEATLNKKGLYDHLVLPCSLIFDGAFNIKINFDFGITNGLFIQDIRRTFIGKSPGHFDIYRYDINTEVGSISFDCTEFRLEINGDAVLSESFVLKRD